jgi:hypothetical protein
MVNILSWLVDAKGIGIPVRDCGSFEKHRKTGTGFSYFMGMASQLKIKLMIQMYSKVLCDARYYARLFLLNDERQIFHLIGKRLKSKQ